MTRDDDVRFHTGFDLGMAVIIGVCTAPLLVMGWQLAAARTVLWGTAASTLLLFWYLYRTTHYTFTATALVARCGPLAEQIAYDTVRGAKRSASVMSGFAMSLHRIAIEYDGYNSILISPDDRGAFLAELARRAPHARIDDGDA